MHFLTIWTFRPDQTNRTLARFDETGALPPDGVTMLSRWHDLAGGRGFAIFETDDPVAIASWCRQWNDLLSFEVIPVVDDEQRAAALAALR